MADLELRTRPETRERLLRAAEWVIIHEGVHALTIRRIAAEADANSALVGYHFGGVDGLLAELARLNSEPILQDQRRAFDALAPDAGLDAWLDAFLKPLWRGAALNPGERALVVVDEIVSRAEADLRRKVWGWFTEVAQPYYAGFARLLPALGPDALRWRLRFLSAAALDLPPRDARSGLGPLDAPLSVSAEADRYRQFLAFAEGALRAP